MVWSGQTIPKQNMVEALFLIIFVKKKNMLAYVFVFNERLSPVKRCADNVNLWRFPHQKYVSLLLKACWIYTLIVFLK